MKVNRLCLVLRLSVSDGRKPDWQSGSKLIAIGREAQWKTGERRFIYPIGLRSWDCS